MEEEMLKYGSFCSGIETPSLAWRSLGWQPLFFSETDPFCSALLAHHYPAVPNLGDMTKIDWSHHGFAPDLIIAGTPCQGFSNAGRRQGLADDRSQLALKFVELVAEIRPRWILWENVAHVLTISQGRDFACFTRALVECGYHLTYRVLDARYFGVPQRRRRVFLVGHLGDWRPAYAVLFEPESLSGHPTSRSKARQEAATSTGAGATSDVSYPLTTSNSRRDPTSETYVVRQDPIAFSYKDSGQDCGTIAPTLRAAGHHRSHANSGAPPAIAYTIHGEYSGALASGTCDAAFPTELARCLDCTGSDPNLNQGANVVLSQKESVVRRFTPRECERLMGIPDDYTLIPWGSQNKFIQDLEEMARYLRLLPEEVQRLAPDSRRYKAVGNAIAVPVLAWLGDRVEIVDKHQQLTNNQGGNC